MDNLANRRQALRAYFLEVIRDLSQRGLLRAAAGQRLEEVLVNEAKTLTRELQTDVASVLGGIGAELLAGGAQMLGGIAARSVENMFGSMAERVARALKR